MSRPVCDLLRHVNWLVCLLPFYGKTQPFQFRRYNRRPNPDVAGFPIPAVRLKSLRLDDQFLVSYPRSGNTWMRHLLRDVIALEHPECAYPKSLSDLVPAIHQTAHAMDTPLGRQFGMPSRIFKSHNVRELRSHRFVYIIRNPADALVSYYHFHRLHADKRALASEGIDEFCNAMVDGWIEHVGIALECQQKRPDDVLIVSYEGLCADTAFELRRITDFLGLSASAESVSLAVERNAFARLRSQEEVRRGASDEYFFRKGRPGAAKEELTPETLENLSKKALGTYQRATSLMAAAHRALRKNDGTEKSPALVWS